MKISVIIPVYNSHKYLAECIESIRNQTYTDFEILLIDDGSTDNSGKVCDEYAVLDSRVRVIHQNNAGTSAARNTGLKNASGDYIMFMDNDDYWNDKISMQNIVRQLEESNADVLMFSTIEYWEKEKKYIYPSNVCSRNLISESTKETALRYLMEKGLMSVTVWAKVIRRDLIIENQLYFVEGIRNEDSEWTAHMMMCAESYDWLEVPFYVYRKGHEGAQTSKKNTCKIVLDLKNILLSYIRLIEEDKGKWSKEFINVFFSYFAYLYSVWMAQAEFIKKEEIKEHKVEMKKYAWILQYDLEPSVKLVNKVYKILGYTITAKLLKVYMSHKYFYVKF